MTVKIHQKEKKKTPSTRKGWGMVAKDIFYDEAWKRLLLVEESRLQYNAPKVLNVHMNEIYKKLTTIK